MAAVNGVATFSTLSINKTGQGYTLTASDGSLAGTTSSSFNIAGTAAKLAFGQQPASATAGTSIGAALTVQVEDANGNTVTNDSSTVTLSLGNNPGGGTLSGTISAVASSGVATFSGLTINKAGTGYTLIALDGGLTGATSNSFNITAGAAVKLGFGQQPSDSVAGANITPAVTVLVQDTYGNTVPTDNSTVTVVIGTNPSGGTLVGSTAVAAVNGVATFNLSIDKTGAGYTLAASDSNSALTGAASNAFAVNSAALDHFKVEADGGGDIGTQTAGIAFNIQITAQDAGNNTVPGFTGTVSISATGAALSGDPVTSGAFTAGILTGQSLKFTGAGNSVTLTAVGGGVAGISNTFVVLPVPVINPSRRSSRARLCPGKYSWDK